MKAIIQRLLNWWHPSELEQRRRGWLWASQSDLSDEEVDAVLGDSTTPFDQGARDYFIGHPIPTEERE